MRLHHLFEAPASISDEERFQTRLAYIMDYLKNNPKDTAKFEKIIRQKARESDPVDDMEARLDPRQTSPETDHAPLLDRFIKLMVDADGDADDMTNFINNYGKTNYIDTAKLTTLNEIVTIESWIDGAPSIGVSAEFIKSLFGKLSPKDNFGGPGETALALLSPKISRPEGNKGDLVINGVYVEVKGESSTGGGRLKNSHDSIGTPNVKPIYDKIYALPNWPEGKELPDMKRISATVTGRKSANKFPLRDVVQEIDQFDNKLADEFLKQMLTGAFNKATGSYSSVFNGWRSFDYAQMHYAASKMAYLNYKAELEAKTGGVEHILLINFPKGISVFFNTNDFDAARKLFKLGPIDWGDSIYGAAVQLSL